MNVDKLRIPWAALRSGENCGPLLVTVIENVLTELGVTYPTPEPCCIGECDTEGFIQPWYPIGPIEYLTDDDGDQDVSLATVTTVMETTDGPPPVTLTVADGTKIGQIKTIRVSLQSISSNDVTVRVDTPIDGTEDTDFFLNVGGHITLMWGCNNAWLLIDLIERTN